MLQVSDEFKEAIKGTQRVLDAKLVFDSKTFKTNEIKSIELSDDILGSGTEFKIGTFITTKGKAEIINQSVPESLEGQECNVYIGTQLLDETFEYTNQGIFKVVNEDVKGQIITLELEDRTNRFDIAYVQRVTFPCTLKAIVNDVCSQTGIELSADFYNSDYVLKNDPALADDTTCRKIIMAVAELMGGYARITNSGKLEFFNLTVSSTACLLVGSDTYSEDSILDGVVGTINLDRHNYFEFTSSKNPLETLTKVSTLYNNIYCSSGNDDGKNYVISENILLASVENQTLCDRLYEKLNGLEYKPMSLKWVGNPAFQCGDYIEIYDGNVFHKNYIMTRKFTFNGGLTEEYSSSGFSKEKDKTKVDGNVRQKIKKAFVEINILDEKIELRVKQDDFETYKSQTATEISQKVTADGACSAVVEKADELKISINGKLSGKTYTFDGDGFTLGGGTGDVVKHTNSGSVYNFSDGSKCIINKDGFYNQIGSNKREYHHLNYSETLRVPPYSGDGYGYTTTTVQLPEEFKGKNFTARVSISEALPYTFTSGIGVITAFGTMVWESDYINGTVTVGGFLTSSNLDTKKTICCNENLKITLTVIA